MVNQRGGFHAVKPPDRLCSRGFGSVMSQWTSSVRSIPAWGWGLGRWVGSWGQNRGCETYTTLIDIFHRLLDLPFKIITYLLLQFLIRTVETISFCLLLHGNRKNCKFNLETSIKRSESKVVISQTADHPKWLRFRSIFKNK